jgi:hypothetical protein
MLFNNTLRQFERVDHTYITHIKSHTAYVNVHYTECDFRTTPKKHLKKSYTVKACYNELGYNELLVTQTNFVHFFGPKSMFTPLTNSSLTVLKSFVYRRVLQKSISYSFKALMK